MLTLCMIKGRLCIEDSSALVNQKPECFLRPQRQHLRWRLMLP